MHWTRVDKELVPRGSTFSCVRRRTLSFPTGQRSCSFVPDWAKIIIISTKIVDDGLEKLLLIALDKKRCEPIIIFWLTPLGDPENSWKHCVSVGSWTFVDTLVGNRTIRWPWRRGTRRLGEIKWSVTERTISYVPVGYPVGLFELPQAYSPGDRGVTWSPEIMVSFIEVPGRVDVGRSVGFWSLLIMSLFWLLVWWCMDLH